ncbi:MAG TPA: flagellar hook-basal body complex protein [Tepidisphaeraceae bacterium]|jgi:flagellar hook protein FlgE|nr:flagellar hook-basal body complex protein [Tepidisphaeraceae bacterium]
MGLTSSLFTGLSGLDSNQAWLNVVGNNIANANTTAFKSSTVSFSPQFYVTDQASSGPNGDFGGTNASQEGTGSEVASITADFTPGQISTTGVDTDLAISGNGFFVLNSTAGQQFTRDGGFTLNGNNQLVTSSGAYVQGYGVDATGNVIPGALQSLTIPLGQETEAAATKNVTLEGNLNSGGALANGATILTSQAFTTSGGTAPTGTTLLSDLVTTGGTPAALVNVGDTLTLAGTRGTNDLPSDSFTVTATSTVNDLENFINQAMAIDTTVSEPGNPTPGTTLQTTGTTAQLTIIGNTGTANALTLGSQGLVDATGDTTPFTMSAGTDGAFTDNPSGESTNTTITAYDSLGNPITVNLTTVLESASTSGTTWRFYATSPNNEAATGSILGNGTLTFSSSGALLASTGTQIAIDRAGTGAQSPDNINLNFSGMTAYASTSSNMVMSTQDGEPIGTLTSFSVGGDGTITGQFSNGLTKSLGQVALANFNNDDGLINDGGNLYQTGPNSGTPLIGGATQNGTGTVQSGALEESNVNLSNEFINLIMASTGFSASSKVISTSDELLTDLLNTQR